MFWWQKTKDHHQYAASTTKQDKGNPDIDHVAIAIAIHRIADETNASRHQGHAQERKKGRREWVTICFIVATAFTTGLQTLFFRWSMTDSKTTSAAQIAEMKTESIAMTGQVHAMNEQIDAIRAGYRPWIQVTGVDVTRIDIKAGNVTIWLDLRFKNSGHSPASNIIAKGVFARIAGMLDADAQTSCSHVILGRNPGDGPTVFPGEPEEFSVPFEAGDLASEKQIALNSVVKQLKAPVTPEYFATQLSAIFFSGCVAYTFEGSNIPHGTSFSGYVYKKGGSDQGGGPATHIDVTHVGSINGADLETKMTIGGTYAN
jgi:hypothetical protein